jgi:hypothetical protein
MGRAEPNHGVCLELCAVCESRELVCGTPRAAEIFKTTLGDRALIECCRKHDLIEDLASGTFGKKELAR